MRIENIFEMYKYVASKYREFDNIDIRFCHEEFLGSDGLYDANQGIIWISNNVRMGALPFLMAHEMAHVIQPKEEIEKDTHGPIWADCESQIITHFGTFDKMRREHLNQNEEPINPEPEKYPACPCRRCRDEAKKEKESLQKV